MGEVAWQISSTPSSMPCQCCALPAWPAFDGYVAEAQRNTILKMIDKHVWKILVLGNRWGNVRINPDPTVRENILISG